MRLTTTLDLNKIVIMKDKHLFTIKSELSGFRIKDHGNIQFVVYAVNVV